MILEHGALVRGAVRGYRPNDLADDYDYLASPSHYACRAFNGHCTVWRVYLKGSHTHVMTTYTREGAALFMAEEAERNG